MKSEAVITGNSEKLIFMKKKLKIKLKKNKRKKKQVAKRETLSCGGFQFRHSAREAEGLPLYRPSKKSDCGCVRFGNLDFGFCNRTRNPITRISWISFLPFDWEIRKRICKTVRLNSRLFLANYACACKTAVLKDSFQILLRISQSNSKYRDDISALKYVFGLRVRLQIRNPDFPVEGTVCVLSKIRLLICYTIVPQSVTHILGEIYKIDIKCTLFTFTI